MNYELTDDLKSIKKIDKSDMLGSLRLLGGQAEEVWQNARDFKTPVSYKSISKVVVAGMGGSALGARIIKTLFAADLKVPLEIVNDYVLPKYVNSKTLVIISSYSGGTEESLSAFNDALKKKAKIVAICAGGKLAQMAKKNKKPSLVFTTSNNPCGQPRMGLGYSLVGQLAILKECGILKFSLKDLKEAVKTINYYDGKYGVLSPKNENFAKQLAEKSLGKSVWYIASEHILGNAHTAANQMNESGKRLAGYFAIPELNHHLMEGMMYPVSNKKDLFFVFLESGLYGKRTLKRYEITRQVLNKNGVQHFTYKFEEKTKLSQVCEMLVFGAYVAYYCAMLKKIDPTKIPFVNYFKAEIAK